MIFYEYEYVCIPISKYFRIHKSAYDYDCIRTSKRDYKCIYFCLPASSKQRNIQYPTDHEE